MQRVVWFLVGVLLSGALSGWIGTSLSEGIPVMGVTPATEAARKRACRHGSTLIVGNSAAQNIDGDALEARLPGGVGSLWTPASVGPGWYLALKSCVESGTRARRLLVVGNAAGMLADRPASELALARSLAITTVDDPVLQDRMAGAWPWSWVKIRARARARAAWVRKGLFRRTALFVLRARARRGLPDLTEWNVVADGFGVEHEGLTERVDELAVGRPANESFLPALAELAVAQRMKVGLVMMPGRTPTLGNAAVDVAAVRAFADAHRHVRLFDLREGTVAAAHFRDEIHMEEEGRVRLTRDLLAALEAGGWGRR